MLIRLRNLVFGLFALSAGAGLAKDPPPLPPPPMAQAENISMYRGQTIEIPLRTSGRAPGQLKFLIRSQPTQGTLGGIRIIDRKNAVITYTHDDDAGPGTDRFLFAAQAPDSAVSAAAPISILITEQPPALTTSSSVDFGTVLLGESAEEEITIRNTGGGQLTGEITAPPPWSVAGSKNYSLSRGEEATVRLKFSPTEELTFNGRLSFSSDERTWVLLAGQGREAVSVTPRQAWELSGTPDSQERTLEVRLKNQTEEERSTEFLLPFQLEKVPTVTLGPGEEKKIILRARPDQKDGLETTATVRTGQYDLKIPLTIFALPASLHIEPAGPVDFGTVATGRRAKRTIQIRNDGGLDARLSINAPREILVVPDPNASVLAPGEMKSFDLTYEAAQGGAWTGQLAIRANAGTPTQLPLVAHPASQPSLVQLRPATEPEEKKEPLAAPPTAPLLQAADAPPGNAIPPIQAVTLLGATQDTVRISWKKPASNAIGYRVEQRVLDLSTGQLKVLWSPWKNTSLQTDDQGIVEGSLSGLLPGQVIFIRILTIDELGKRSAPSPLIRLSSVPRKPWPAWVWVLPLLLLGAAGWLLWRKLQVATFDEDQARLDQLGKS